tara:strand:- start:119058 stop:119231 length:174 start_codon:yes stop_codon:yes gene_type:complete
VVKLSAGALRDEAGVFCLILSNECKIYFRFSFEGKKISKFTLVVSKCVKFTFKVANV